MVAKYDDLELEKCTSTRYTGGFVATIYIHGPFVKQLLNVKGL